MIPAPGEFVIWMDPPCPKSSYPCHGEEHGPQANGVMPALEKGPKAKEKNIIIKIKGCHAQPDSIRAVPYRGPRGERNSTGGQPDDLSFGRESKKWGSKETWLKTWLKTGLPVWCFPGVRPFAGIVFETRGEEKKIFTLVYCGPRGGFADRRRRQQQVRGPLEKRVWESLRTRRGELRADRLFG